MPIPKFQRQIIPIRGNGPIRAQIEAYDGMLAMYSENARRAIAQDAMWQGGEYYRTVFVPLKFTNYAKKYGYHVSAKYQTRKQKMFGEAIPLVFTDEASHNGLRSQVLNGSVTKAKVTPTKCFAEVHMPGPAYMKATETVFRTLNSALPEELERVAGVVGEALADNLDGTASKRGGGNKPIRLTDSQKQTFARSGTVTKSRKAPGAAPRRAA